MKLSIEFVLKGELGEVCIVIRPLIEPSSAKILETLNGCPSAPAAQGLEQTMLKIWKSNLITRKKSSFHTKRGFGTVTVSDRIDLGVT